MIVQCFWSVTSRRIAINLDFRVKVEVSQQAEYSHSQATDPYDKPGKSVGYDDLSQVQGGAPFADNEWSACL